MLQVPSMNFTSAQPMCCVMMAVPGGSSITKTLYANKEGKCVTSGFEGCDSSGVTERVIKIRGKVTKWVKGFEPDKV